MMFARVLYTGGTIFVSFCLATAICALAGCGGARQTGWDSDVRVVVEAINAKRIEQGQEPLAVDADLARAAQERVDGIAAKNSVEPDATPLPRVVAAGCYARFAMSHEARGPSIGAASAAIVANPLAMSKARHPSLTHIGVAFAETREAAFVVIDLARLVPRLEPEQARAAIVERLREKRVSNSVEPLELSANLDQMAASVAERFMAGGVDSDALIAEAQQRIGAESFAMGRVIVTFQVAGDLDSIAIPERTSDPALALAGLGLAQGNHRDHEAGAVAVALFLAEPQTAHDSARELSDLPPPKAVPTGGAAAGKGSLTDQAWVATLTGNHRKAAGLFEKAFAKAKQPALLYEAARAHARNGDNKAALDAMQRYAELVEGEELKKAAELAARLERGESIFPASAEGQLSVEAQRFLLIGKRLFEQGEWDGAIDAFQQAYSYARHPDIIYNIGLTHVRAGRVGEALNFFEEYQRCVPEARNVDEAQQLFNIGVELYRLGQFEAASRHFAMAYAVLPIPDLVYNLALCRKALGQKEEAQRLLREFIDSGPDPKDKADAEAMLDELSAQPEPAPAPRAP
ncbi:MAG TPA: tetratricopeptide repeat protein [Polyangia bacterium]|nr:tetratricopeptide repeat protein [Polyangia bacterium]